MLGAARRGTSPTIYTVFGEARWRDSRSAVVRPRRLGSIWVLQRIALEYMLAGMRSLQIACYRLGRP